MILSQLGVALAARLRWVEWQLELVVVSALPVGRRAPVVRLAPEAFTFGNDPLVCVQNAGRSQMAQVFYERRGGQARSAGTPPVERVHPEVAEAMSEVRADVADRVPTALSRDDVEWADIVVTMDCGDQWPYVPGKQYVDWDLTDPAGKGQDEVRAIRDEIERRVGELPL